MDSVFPDNVGGNMWDKNSILPRNIYDSSMIENKVMVLNTRTRFPIVVVIDSTSSFCNQACNVEVAVNNLIDSIKKDRELANSIELSMISDIDGESGFYKLCEFKKHYYEYGKYFFHFSPDVSLGQLLKFAIYQIEGREEVLLNSRPRIRYYPPMVLLISDGVVDTLDRHAIEDEDLQFAIEYIQKNVMANKMIVYALTQNDSNNCNILQELTGLDTEKHIVKNIDEYSLAYTLKIVAFKVFHPHLANVPINELEINL